PDGAARFPELSCQLTVNRTFLEGDHADQQHDPILPGWSCLLSRPSEVVGLINQGGRIVLHSGPATAHPLALKSPYPSRDRGEFVVAAPSMVRSWWRERPRGGPYERAGEVGQAADVSRTP